MDFEKGEKNCKIKQDCNKVISNQFFTLFTTPLTYCKNRNTEHLQKNDFVIGKRKLVKETYSMIYDFSNTRCATLEKNIIG